MEEERLDEFGAQDQRETLARFERSMLPHLDAAHNLARWQMRGRPDAEDAVQEAYLRAFRFFGGFRGGDSRAWLLKIVRNTCYDAFQKSGAPQGTDEFDEALHTPEAAGADPEAMLLRGASQQALRDALGQLPTAFREVLVLREMEGLSYKEIAGVLDVPIGTVMSSLARARDRLRQILTVAPVPRELS
jgi:RNA polymerase sigma factor (sigma-70 family)